MYDLIIVGSGPAGFSASIYASCFQLKHIVFGAVMGGQMSLAPDILNYPGFNEISGSDLTKRMLDQAKMRGGEIKIDSVTGITKINSGFKVDTQNNHSFETQTLILASGVERRKLNVPGETAYTGKGVQYCSQCENFDYQNKVVAVVGGANAAAQAAIQIAQGAEKVYILYRGDRLRCDPIRLTQLESIPKIQVVPNVLVSEIIGDGQRMTGVKLKSVINNQPLPIPELMLERLFIEIGGVPGTALLIPLGIRMDPGGYLEVNEQLATNIPGIYAAGDVVSHKYSIEQISAAVGSGAKAAMSVFTYLKSQTAPKLWGSNQIPQNS